MLGGFDLAHLRLHYNLTQEQVAKDYGCTKNYVSMLENNKEHFATEEKYQKYIKSIYACIQKDRLKQRLNSKKEDKAVKTQATKQE